MAEASKRSRSAQSRRRRTQRALFIAIVALAVVGAVIITRAFVPGGLFGEHTAPLYKLDRELKSAPETTNE
jgi:hypothetical protein